VAPDAPSVWEAGSRLRVPALYWCRFRGRGVRATTLGEVFARQWHRTLRPCGEPLAYRLPTSRWGRCCLARRVFLAPAQGNRGSADAALGYGRNRQSWPERSPLQVSRFTRVACVDAVDESRPAVGEYDFMWQRLQDRPFRPLTRGAHNPGLRRRSLPYPGLVQD
jgi:hypothetical protein